MIFMRNVNSVLFLLLTSLKIFGSTVYIFGGYILIIKLDFAVTIITSGGARGGLSPP
jgi:hypothetical protein